MRFNPSAFALLSVLVLPGCMTNRIANFTVHSTRTTKLAAGKKQAPQRAKASDCRFAFVIPFGIPDIKTATEKAIESAGPGYDALIDGEISSSTPLFLIGNICYHVEGTVIDSKREAADEKGASPGRGTSEEE